jgi:hypothetical protein
MTGWETDSNTSTCGAPPAPHDSMETPPPVYTSDSIPLDAPSSLTQADVCDSLSRIMDEVFNEIPPEHVPPTAADDALADITMPPTDWNRFMDPHTSSIFYSDTNSDGQSNDGNVPRPSIYEPISPVPDTTSYSGDSELSKLKMLLKREQTKSDSLLKQVDSLRDQLSTLTNAMTREMWKRQKLASEVLTSRYCLALSELMFQNNTEVVKLAAKNYARLAFVTHKAFIQKEMKTILDPVYKILGNTGNIE